MHGDEGMPRAMVYGLVGVGVVGVLALVFTILFVGGDDSDLPDLGPANQANKDALPTAGNSKAKGGASNPDGTPSTRLLPTDAMSDKGGTSTQPKLGPNLVASEDEGVTENFNLAWEVQPEAGPAIDLKSDRLCSFRAPFPSVRTTLVNQFEFPTVALLAYHREYRSASKGGPIEETTLEYIQLNTDRGAIKVALPLHATLLDLRGDRVVILSPDRRDLHIYKVENLSLQAVGVLRPFEREPVKPRVNHAADVHAWLVGDDQILVAHHAEKKVGLWTIGESQPVWMTQPEGQFAAEMSPSRHLLLVALRDELVFMDAHSGERKGRLAMAGNVMTSGAKVCFSQDGRWLAYMTRGMSSRAKTTRIWNLEKGELLAEANGEGDNLAWTKDAKHLVTGEELFDVELQDTVWRYKPTGGIKFVPISGTDRMWYLTTNTGGRTVLVATEPIDERIIKELAKNDPSIPPVFGPGDRVALKIGLPLSNDVRETLDAHVASGLEANDVIIDAKAANTLNITGTISRGAAKKYGSTRNPLNRQGNITLYQQNVEVKMTLVDAKGTVLWKRQLKTVANPGYFVQGNAGEAQKSVDTQARFHIVAFVQTNPLPRKIYADGGGRNRVSTLGSNGLSTPR